jgi:hypothetical protein
MSELKLRPPKEIKMPSFPAQTVGTPTNRGKARRYKDAQVYSGKRANIKWSRGLKLKFLGPNRGSRAVI